MTLFGRLGEVSIGEDPRTVPSAESPRRDRHWFILYVVVCLEVGIFLALVPWFAVWERNYFLEAYPSLRPILLDPSVRGAVAGLGLANIFMGLKEAFSRRQGLSQDRSSPPARREAVSAPLDSRDEESHRGGNRKSVPAEDRG